MDNKQIEFKTKKSPTSSNVSQIMSQNGIAYLFVGGGT